MFSVSPLVLGKYDHQTMTHVRPSLWTWCYTTILLFPFSPSVALLFPIITNQSVLSALPLSRSSISPGTRRMYQSHISSSSDQLSQPRWKDGKDLCPTFSQTKVSGLLVVWPSYRHISLYYNILIQILTFCGAWLKLFNFFPTWSWKYDFPETKSRVIVKYGYHRGLYSLYHNPTT